mgnify:CR=1 FL=1
MRRLIIRNAIAGMLLLSALLFGSASCGFLHAVVKKQEQSTKRAEAAKKAAGGRLVDQVCFTADNQPCKD